MLEQMPGEVDSSAEVVPEDVATAVRDALKDAKRVVVLEKSFSVGLGGAGCRQCSSTLWPDRSTTSV